jgi:tRNA pseudouridine13 synthase
LRLGHVPFHRKLDSRSFEALKSDLLPLPSARLKLSPDSVWRQVLDSVLTEDGLTLETMKLRGVQKPFFSRGERPVLSLPRELAWQMADDDRHANKAKLTLAFELSKGSYATLIVKRAQAAERCP